MARIFCAGGKRGRRKVNGDAAAERERLGKEVARAEAKVADQRFVERAPSDVVAAEREKLERYRRELALLGAPDGG